MQTRPKTFVHDCRSKISYLFSRGNAIFIRESRGILKSDVCDNHGLHDCVLTVFTSD